MKHLPRRRVFLAPLLFIAAALAVRMRAQAPAPQPAAPTTNTVPATAPAFEVAIVRLGGPPTTITADNLSRFPANHFYVRNLPLNFIVGVAFGIDWSHVDGGPSWMETQNYFIDAKVEGDQQLTKEQMEPLLQNLLAQRLGLKAHHESRLVAGYEMVVSKGGSKLQPAKGGRNFGGVGPDRIEGSKESAAQIAQFVSYAVHQPVVDHTGLTGSYDIKLSYAPPNDPNATSNNPDLFTAIQEQLGLKLVPAKVPVDYLVIDHVDRIPTEN